MPTSMKFRMTKELTQDMDGTEKALATLSGMILLTVVADIPETTVSVVEDVAGVVGKAWSSIFG